MKRDYFNQIHIVILMSIAASIPLKWIMISSVLIIVWGALVIAKAIVTRNINFISWRTFILLSSFYFISLLSGFYSENIPVVFTKLETRLSIAAFPLLFLCSSRISQATLNKILASFLTSCLVVSVICVSYIFYSNYSQGITFTDGTSWFFSADNLVDKYGFHPSYFSIYCSFCVFILIFFFKKKIIGTTTLVFGILYIIFFLLLLASRVGLIAFVLVFAITVAYEAYVRRKLMVGLIVMTCFVGLMLLVVLNTHIPREKLNAMFGVDVHQYNKTFMMTKRYEEWKSALEVFRNNPIVGVGVGDMQDELQKVYLSRGFLEGYENAYNPHNLFLDAAAALGVIGLLSLSTFFILCLARAIKAQDILYIQLLVLFLLISMVEATLSVQKGIVFFTFFNTLFYIGVSDKEGDATIKKVS